MTHSLPSLLENQRCGAAQVAARKAHIATLKGNEAEAHKASLAREESDLATITALIESIEHKKKP